MRRWFLMWSCCVVLYLTTTVMAATPTMSPDGVWVGNADADNQIVSAVIWRAPGTPWALRTIMWVDSRGVTLGEIRFGRPPAAPAGTVGSAILLYSTWTGLNMIPHPRVSAGERDYVVPGIIDVRSAKESRFCFMTPKDARAARALSFSREQKGNAVCFDLFRLDVGKDCVEECIKKSQMKAVGAGVIKGDCERSCSRKAPTLKK